VTTRELIEKEAAALPEPFQRELDDFARFLRFQKEDDPLNGLLLSETELVRDSDTTEEDAPWASL